MPLKKWLVTGWLIISLCVVGGAVYAFDVVANNALPQTQLTQQHHEPVKISERELRAHATQASSRSGLQRQRMEVIATAYTPADDEGEGLAADGRPAVPYQTIAVDPEVIPPGCRVYVPGFGIMDPHDTGGNIKGNRIDICVATKEEAFAWGVRRIEIEIIR